MATITTEHTISVRAPPCCTTGSADIDLIAHSAKKHIALVGWRLGMFGLGHRRVLASRRATKCREDVSETESGNIEQPLHGNVVNTQL